MAGIFGRSLLGSGHGGAGIFTPEGSVDSPRKGYRWVSPWPRPRWASGQLDSAYPSQGYFTTGSPAADASLRAPVRYGLPEQLGGTEESADWDYGPMGCMGCSPAGLGDPFPVVGAPQTIMGMLVWGGLALGIGYTVWTLGKYAVAGK